MAAPSNPLQSFIWGRGGAALTPEQVARESEIAEALMASGADTSPVAHWLQGAARLGSTLSGKVREGRASSAEAAGRSAYSDRFNSLFGGGMAATPPVMGGSPATSTAMATAPAPDYASARVAQAHGGGGFDDDLRSGIIATAEAIGADPIDLATAISYETAGTFDPLKKGPTTQWGQHRGLIQFGEPQAKQHGVDWENPLGSQLGPDGAVANYFRSSGFKPGMSGLDLYSTINAGSPGRYSASDANNGGAPGNVRDKWENQMAGHRQKAQALIGEYVPGGAVAANEAMASGDLTAQAVQDWAAQQGQSGLVGTGQMLTGDVDGQMVTGEIAQPGVMVAESPEQIAAAEAAMMDPAFMQSGVTVAETPEEILAAEAAMAAPQGTQPRLEPAMAAPPLPAPTMVPDMQVAEIAQALTGNPVNPDVPMAGSTSGFAPMGTQAPNVSLPQEASFSLPNPQQQIAQSLAGQPQQQGGGQPSMQQLVQAVSDPWATDAQRQVATALLKQRMEQDDPMSQLQLQKAQLELQQMQNPQATLINAGGGQLYNPNTGEWISAPGGGGAGEGPAAFQTLHLRAVASGLVPGSREYQQFMAQGGRSPEESAANQRIERLTENLMSTGDFIDPMDARNIAVGIADGRLRADRHPITGVLQVVDLATGRPAYEQRTPQPTAGDAMLQPAPTAEGGQFGQQYPNAPGSFGVEGAAQGAINRVTDTLGVGPAYPDVAQTQADFAVLRESLLNDIASSYGRQPPSWLLKEIRDLTPEAGSVFQGPGAAQSKLNALGRHLTGELENTNRALQRDLSPTNRQEMEARQQGLIAGLERVNGALQSFGGQEQQQGAAPQPGMVEDGYRFKGGDPADPNSWEPVQ